jgi:hypothetical protein
MLALPFLSPLLGTMMLAPLFAMPAMFIIPALLFRGDGRRSAGQPGGGRWRRGRAAAARRPGKPTEHRTAVAVYGGLLAVAVWSLIMYYVAIARRLPTDKVDQYVAEAPPFAE